MATSSSLPILTPATIAAPGARASVAAEGPSDLQLVARVQAGERDAYRTLVERHQRGAFSIALRMLGSRADAEDAAQQAFTDAYRALDRFEGEDRPNAFRVWLFRIVVNHARDVLKSKKRSERPLDGEVISEEAAFAHAPAGPEEHTRRVEEHRRLSRALAALPEKYRTCLVLKDVEDLSYEEMRSILRLPITTLKIRVVRARAFVRERLEREVP